MADTPICAACGEDATCGSVDYRERVLCIACARSEHAAAVADRLDRHFGDYDSELVGGRDVD